MINTPLTPRHCLAAATPQAPLTWEERPAPCAASPNRPTETAEVPVCGRRRWPGLRSVVPGGVNADDENTMNEPDGGRDSYEKGQSRSATRPLVPARFGRRPPAH